MARTPNRSSGAGEQSAGPPVGRASAPPAGAPQGPPENQAGERNRLLKALPTDEYTWIRPYLETIRFDVGDVIAEANEPYRYVYFPETTVVSLVSRMSGGGVVEVGTVGCEGMVGVNVFLDADTMTSTTIAQVPGEARRMPVEIFGDGIQERPEFQRSLRRYTHAFLTQVAQTAACNGMHELEQRCARWLLMTHDRVGRTDEFILTHEFLAFMLGVRRAGVTVAMGELQDAGIIKYSRGKVRVLDRAALERASCECYGIVRAVFDRLLGTSTG